MLPTIFGSRPWIFGVVALTLFCSGARALAEPAGPRPYRIAVVNVERVFREYQETRETEQRLGALTGEKQSERGRRVSQIRDLKDELVLLNDRSRADRQRTVEEKLRELAEFDRQTRESLIEERAEALERILGEIQRAVAAYAQEQGFDLIVDRRAVLFGVEALDVTEEVLERLNAEYGKKKS